MIRNLFFEPKGCVTTKVKGSAFDSFIIVVNRAIDIVADQLNPKKKKAEGDAPAEGAEGEAPAEGEAAEEAPEEAEEE